MTIPIIPVFTGTSPDRNTQSAAAFTINSIEWLDYQLIQIDATNVSIEGINVAVIQATDAAATSLAAANYIGEWDTNPDGTPRVGALAVPASVSHLGETWLLTANVADVTAVEPGVAAVWQKITPDPQTTTNTASIDKLKLRTPISGVSTVPVGFGYFATANATITMPDVTGFAGGEKFSIVASLAATLSTLTVDGTQSEEIAPRNGDATDTVFNLTTIGVSFEFIFNVVTGNWEV